MTASLIFSSQIHFIYLCLLFWFTFVQPSVSAQFVLFFLIYARWTRGLPESQQPTGSQIIRICMGIYRKIDKTVKMHINSY